MAILKLGNNNSAFSGSFSGSFQGNGSQLTNLPITDPFPLNGNATITGSLTVSSSFADFSGLTDIKTRKFAITSDHVSGQTVTSASFYDSFVEALDASVDGDTLHVFSNDSSSVTNDIFEEKNITIVGNGFHFDIVGAGTNNHRWTFTSCSIDVYDFEFRRTPTSNLSNFDTSVWEIKGPSNWHFYNSGFAATKNAHALMIEGDNINIDGVYARLTDSTSYLTYAVYKDTTTNDFTLENFDIHSEAGGIFAQGDRVKIENGNIDYSTTIDRSNAITITGHTGSISNVNILGNDDNSQNVALRIDPTTGANSRGITFIENVNIRSGEITVQNDAHVIIGDCKVFNIQQRSDCLYFAGTGSITNCNIEYDERMGGYTSGAAGIKLHTSQEVRISNCHVFGYQFGLENTYPENIITVYDSYFETGLSYSGNGKAIYGLDTKTATIVGCQGVINISTGQGFGLDLQTTGSGKIHILNSDFINKGSASSYGQCFKLIGSSANNEIYVSDVNVIIDAPNNNTATSAALSISGVTGSYFNNLYIEGYKAGTINAISSSIVNSTFYQKKISSTATAWVLNAAGNENLYSNCIFEVDPEFDAYSQDFLVTTYNTQRYHNSTFKGGKDPNYIAITGNGAANVELIGNRFINVPYANITASNVTDITTGYIDGRGNWHKSQVTSSFDHIEATSFKGNGSQLTNLPITDPFPHTASSAAIISRSIASGDTDSTTLRLIGSGSISSSGIFEIEGSAGPLFSVQDGLDGVLMEVNNITGLPLFQVSSSNEVFINRGNLTSGTTTATASFAHFTGSFKGDGSQLTGVDAFPFTGDAQITGSLIISGSSLNLISGSFRVVSPTRGTMFNIDDNTFTLGPGASAGGGYTAVAIGHNASTGNNYSVSIGSGATTNANTYAVAIGGASVSANGMGGIAIGGNGTFAGSYGVSMGYQASGTGNYSINLGRSSRSTGANSVTINTSGDTIAAPSNSRAFNLYLTDGTGNPDFVISASNESKLSGSSFTIEKSGSKVFEVIGSEGTLFSVSDNLTTGSLFAVKDINGFPLLDVTANSTTPDTVTVGQSNLILDSGSLQVTGSTGISGSLQIQGIADVSASIAAASTPTPAFPFTGDAQITGSLKITGSFEAQSGTSLLHFETGASTGSADGKLSITSTGGSANISLHRTDGKQAALLAGTNSVGIHYDETGKFAIGPANNPATASAFTTPTSFVMDSSGRVGINTSTPNARLAVVGKIKTSVGLESGAYITASSYIKAGSYIQTDSHITASGNISASGDVITKKVGIIDGAGIGLGFEGGGNEDSDVQIFTDSAGEINFVKNSVKAFTINSANQVVVQSPYSLVVDQNISASGNLIGAGLTLPSFPTNRVPFIGSNGVLTTEAGFEYNSTTNQLSVDSLNVIHLTSSFITSSRIHTSGSNIFGDDTTDTQTLIGTTKMTGSAQISGSLTFGGAAPIDLYTGGPKMAIDTSAIGGIKTKGALFLQSSADSSYNSRILFGTTNSLMSFGRLNDSSAGIRGVTQNYAWQLFGIRHGYNNPGSGFHYTTNLPDTTFTDNLTISGSGTYMTEPLKVHGSGSSVFEVIGTEGTLFAIDDDLDGTIFSANDRTGLPVLEASASGEVYIGKSPQSLYTTAVISSTTANISQSIYGLSTSSYSGVFVDYTANSGSNARAGSIMSAWNGSNLNFTETTTLDIGDTSDLIMQVAISQSQAQIQSYTTSTGYKIKTIIRSI